MSDSYSLIIVKTVGSREYSPQNLAIRGCCGMLVKMPMAVPGPLTVSEEVASISRVRMSMKTRCPLFVQEEITHFENTYSALEYTKLYNCQRKKLLVFRSEGNEKAY